MKNRIRVERAEVRMTQQQLADAIGVSRQTVNAIEAGRFVPSTVLALKIARIFGKPVEQVFQLEDGTDRGDIPADKTRGDGTAWYRPLCFHGRRSVPNRPSPSMRRDAVAKAL